LSLRIKFLSFLPFLFGIVLWVKDGARVAFWLTSVEERKEIPIVDGMPELGTQTQVIWKEQFLSGIETPLIGVLLSLTILLVFHRVIKLGANKKNSKI